MVPGKRPSPQIPHFLRALFAQDFGSTHFVSHPRLRSSNAPEGSAAKIINCLLCKLWRKYVKPPFVLLSLYKHKFLCTIFLSEL